MKSHHYEFETRDALRWIGLALIPVALFAVLMHLGATLRLLPRPRPTLDVDRTVLIHQAEAASAPQDAEILLLGDSSCLMDISAKQLSQRLDRRALNLGTFSYLDLESHAALLRAYVKANPGRLRTVVLLMHPEALRRSASEPSYLRLLQSLLNDDQDVPANRSDGIMADPLGPVAFKERLWARFLPTPLPGAFGRRYGFSRDLERFMTDERGSVFDPEPRPFQGNAEYRLAPSLQSASRAFRTAVPPGVKLFVGITPVPAGFAPSGFTARVASMLAQWSGWLQADRALVALPATLPDVSFNKTTHLKESAVPAYTETLAAALR